MRKEGYEHGSDVDSDVDGKVGHHIPDDGSSDDDDDNDV